MVRSSMLLLPLPGASSACILHGMHARATHAARTRARLCAPTLQVRSGQEVENAEIVRFARLFNDELTLDNLERVQVGRGIGPLGLRHSLI